jgi:cell division topological specificity factor MinE
VFLALKQKIFGSGRETSKDRARSRLHFVLVQDRSGLTGDQMAKFKQEMVAVIEKYFDVDKKSFDIAYKRDSDSTTLQISSPLMVKRLTSVKNSNKKPTEELPNPA